mmetsp:Transcript_60825/g.121919  ORF Transcript_60825/g.121919 Transcript_60825/m.121919 type:complete len:182 (-) Transcript_60825:54-599(-)
MGASHAMAGFAHMDHHDDCPRVVLQMDHAVGATLTSFSSRLPRSPADLALPAMQTRALPLQPEARAPAHSAHGGVAQPPRPKTSFAGNLASTEERLTKWPQKHERTQEGFLCAAAGVRDGQAFTGCTDNLPAPDGTEGARWCYIEPSVARAAGKDWGFCRTWSGWPDEEDPGKVARRGRKS